MRLTHLTGFTLGSGVIENRQTVYKVDVLIDDKLVLRRVLVKFDSIPVCTDGVTIQLPETVAMTFEPEVLHFWKGHFQTAINFMYRRHLTGLPSVDFEVHYSGDGTNPADAALLVKGDASKLLDTDSQAVSLGGRRVMMAEVSPEFWAEQREKEKIAAKELKELLDRIT